LHSASLRPPRPTLGPQRGVMLVEVQVSSTKTKRSRAELLCPSRHASRALATSSRDCSAAQMAFFSCRPQFLQISANRSAARLGPAGGQALTDRRDGQVRIGRDPPLDVLLVRQQYRLLEPAEPGRCNIACRTISLHQLENPARAYIEPLGDLPTRGALRHSFHELAPKIIRIPDYPWFSSADVLDISGV